MANFSNIFSRFKKNTEVESEEMTFIEHLEALRWHIIRSLLVWMVLAIVFFVYINWIFDNVILAPKSNDFISYKLMCKFSHFIGIGNSLCMPPVNFKLQFTTLNGSFMAALNISMIGAFIAAFPYIFYEFWRFIKPALTPKEAKYGNTGIFWVSFCMFFGVAFGYYILAPFTINFLSNFQLGTHHDIEYKPTLDDYISSMTNLLLGCGIAFELPIFAIVLAKLGVINAKFLANYRRYAYVIILIVAAILTPSPDAISQAIVAAPLLLLFEISIILVKRIDAKKKIEEATWE